MASTIEEDKKVLENLLTEWEKDSKVDKASPNESAAEISSLHAKYLRILSKNTINIHEADKEYKRMRRYRAAYYDGLLDAKTLNHFGWDQYLGKAPRVSSHREELLNHDEYLLQIIARREIYELIVANCEKIIKEINSRHYTIKAFMEWEMRIRNG